MIKLILKILAAAVVMGGAVPAWFCNVEKLSFDYQMVLFGALFGAAISILNWLSTRERDSDGDLPMS